MRSTLHLVLHVAIPLVVALVGFRSRWRSAAAIMIATMLVDVDHLLANPIYDPQRCSIGFHPLHTWPAMLAYVALLIPKRSRLVGLGLLIHMALDGVDCVWMHF